MPLGEARLLGLLATERSSGWAGRARMWLAPAPPGQLWNQSLAPAGAGGGGSRPSPPTEFSSEGPDWRYRERGLAGGDHVLTVPEHFKLTQQRGPWSEPWPPQPPLPPEPALMCLCPHPSLHGHTPHMLGFVPLNAVGSLVVVSFCFM